MARKPNQRRQVEKLVKDFEPRLRRAFEDAVLKARESVDRSALIAALEGRDIERAARLLQINQAVLFPLTDAVRGAYIAGAELAAPTVPAAIAGSFAFDGFSERAEQWLQTRSADLVQGITEDSLEASRKALSAGLAENRGTRDVARDLTGRMVNGKRRGGLLGLTSEQTDYVLNARSDLQNLDSRYFTRKLRDRRFDGKVRRAIASGKPLSAADIDKLTDRYKDRLLAHRGRLIAQNETFTAQAAGRAEAYRQLDERDDVEETTKRWQHSPQSDPRNDHAAMDGTTVKADEDFELPSGVRMSHPHDPRGGAAENAFCKCVAIFRVKVKR